MASSSLFMSAPFSGVGGVVLPFSAEMGHPPHTLCFLRLHHVWRACVVVSSLIALARAGAGVWARWGGGGISCLRHVWTVFFFGFLSHTTAHNKVEKQ